MSRRAGFMLGLFIAVALAAALLLGSADKPGTNSGVGADGSAKIGSALFPELAARLNDVTDVQVASATTATQMSRAGDGAWAFAGLPGIPVDASKLLRTLIGLSRVKYETAKTDDPALYDAIGLGGDATRITFKGDDFQSTLIIGKANNDTSRFVRVEGAARTYLAGPIALPQAAIGQWAGFELPTVEEADVAMVSVRGDGFFYQIARGDDGTLALLNMAPDETLAYDGVLEAVTSSASYIDFEDIQPSDALTWEGPACCVAFTIGTPPASTVFTYDVTRGAGGSHWLRVRPDGNYRPPEGAPALDWPKWAFKISAFRAGELLKPRGDLLAAQPQP